MHDTSVQMIERHYARYIVDGLEEMTARAVIPLVVSNSGGADSHDDIPASPSDIQKERRAA